MNGQLDFGSTSPKGTRTFFLTIHDGLGWTEIADADSPQDLMEEVRRQRADHPNRQIAIRSRDPRHDSFVAGWRARERIGELPDWIVGSTREDGNEPPW
jgi:hypothetical protein